MERDNFVTTSRLGYDTELATDLLLVRELGVALAFCIDLNPDSNEHKITRSKTGSRVASVDAITVSLAKIFAYNSNDLTGKVHTLSSVLDVVKD